MKHVNINFPKNQGKRFLEFALNSDLKKNLVDWVGDMFVDFVPNQISVSIKGLDQSLGIDEVMELLVVNPKTSKTQAKIAMRVESSFDLQQLLNRGLAKMKEGNVFVLKLIED